MTLNSINEVSLDIQHNLWSLSNLVWRSYFVVAPGETVRVDYSRFCKGGSRIGEAPPVNFMNVYMTLDDGYRYIYEVEIEPDQSSILLCTSTLLPRRVVAPEKESLRYDEKFTQFQPGAKIEISIGVNLDDGDSAIYPMAIGCVDGENLQRFAPLGSIFQLLKGVLGIPLMAFRLLVLKKYD